MLPNRISYIASINSNAAVSSEVNSMSATIRLRIEDKSSYSRLIHELQHAIAPKHLLLLEGEVGVGKTQFARLLIQSLLGKQEHVPSPTFSLLQRYQTPRGTILHADLYRLEEMKNNNIRSIEMARELGLAEELAYSFVMIEWAERLPIETSTSLQASAKVLRLRLKFTNNKNTSESRIAILKLPTHLVTPALLKLQGSVKKNKTSRAIKQSSYSQASIKTTKIKQAFVLAAGYGTRMRGYSTKPKPLVRVAGQALLLHAVKHLQQQGIKSIYVNAHYRAELIAKACLKIKGVTVLLEKTLLETGGAIKNALDVLGEKPFFAVNGDALWYEPNVYEHSVYEHSDEKQQGQNNAIQHNALQPSPTLLACLEQAWAQIEQKKIPATILLALIEEKGARDFQARHCKNLQQKAQLPFPLSFPKEPRHAKAVDLNETRYWRYIGLQILTAKAFKQTPDNLQAFSLKKVYAKEAAAERLYGIVVGSENTAQANALDNHAKANQAKTNHARANQARANHATENYWRGTWMHANDKSSLLRARRLWLKLQKQDKNKMKKQADKT